MHRSLKKLQLVAALMILILGGSVVLAEVAWPPVQDPPATLEAGLDELPAEPAGEVAGCLAAASVDAGELPIFMPDFLREPGSPCCQTQCEQVCGVGQACVCHRCQVLACEL